jgi:hypothetical protein
MKGLINMNIFILLAMIFLHIIDDYKLQGILASMKQKKWWLEQKEYKDLYKNDYIMALVEHSFSWAFMIMLPIAFTLNFNISWWLIAYIINFTVHAFVDDLKANKFKINLVTDQLIHLAQIVATWLIFILR